MQKTDPLASFPQKTAGPFSYRFLKDGLAAKKIMAKNLTQWPMYQFCVVIALLW